MAFIKCSGGRSRIQMQSNSGKQNLGKITVGGFANCGANVITSEYKYNNYVIYGAGGYLYGWSRIRFRILRNDTEVFLTNKGDFTYTMSADAAPWAGLYSSTEPVEVGDSLQLIHTSSSVNYHFVIYGIE